MLDQLNQLEREALDSLAAVNSTDSLTQWQGAHFGTKRSKGKLDEIMSGLGKLAADDRPAFGKRANEVKQALLAALAQKEAAIKEAELAHELQSGAIDVTLPGIPVKRGRLHPSTQVIRRISAIYYCALLWGSMADRQDGLSHITFFQGEASRRAITSVPRSGATVTTSM